MGEGEELEVWGGGASENIPGHSESIHTSFRSLFIMFLRLHKRAPGRTGVQVADVNEQSGDARGLKPPHAEQSLS